jgi:peptidoglycan/LPS O-acetylase OafA/YrhL
MRRRAVTPTLPHRDGEGTSLSVCEFRETPRSRPENAATDAGWGQMAVREQITAGALNPVDREFARFLATRRFGSLDGLRAGSCLLVVWHHTVARGFGGVTLFFALSGFLVTMLLLRDPAARLRRFYTRTALRILPLYFAVLTLYLGLVLWWEKDLGAREQFLENLPAFASFTANWFVDLDRPRVIFYFVWSLSAQVQFYLVWPWLQQRLGIGRAAALALGWLLISQSLGGIFAADARHVLWLRVATSVPAGILCGILLAHALHHRAGFRPFWQLCGRRGSALAALAIVAGIATQPEWFGAGRETLAAAAASLLIAACVVREDNDLAWLLAWRPIVWIGTVSYGVYLLHMLSVNVVRRAEQALEFQSTYLEFALGSLLAIGLASASYRWFESRLREAADQRGHGSDNLR